MGRLVRQIRRVKLHAPTKLGDNETQQKLDHWKATFLLYYSGDDGFQVFLDPDTTWNHGQPNYGFQQEADGLERTPAKMKADLLAFFQLVSSYMPSYYITSKLKYTSCIADVWKLVYRLYGAEITCDTLLNLTSMKKLPQENYRCFMKRITGHVVDHLVGPHVEVDELSSGPVGDRMNISSLNLVTVFWLHLIHPKLPSIVKQEYQKELREGAQVYGLVDRISLNVDNMLARYENDSSVSRILTNDDIVYAAPGAVGENSSARLVTDFPDTGDENYIRFLRGGRTRGGGGSRSFPRSPFAGSRGSVRRGGSRSNFRRGQAFCAHCRSR